MTKVSLAIAGGVIALCLILAFASLASGRYRNQDTFLGHLTPILFDLNTLKVLTEGVDGERIRVTWKTSEAEQTIYADGRSLATFGSDYGSHVFTVYADGEEVAQIRHFSTNSWHVHAYQLNIRAEQDAYRVQLQAVGPDAEVPSPGSPADTFP